MKRGREDDAPPPRQGVAPAQRPALQGLQQHDLNALVPGTQYYLYNPPLPVGGIYLPGLQRFYNVIYHGLVPQPGAVGIFGPPPPRYLRFTYADGPRVGQDLLIDSLMPGQYQAWTSHLPEPAVRRILEYNRSGGKSRRKKRKQRKTKRRK
jgi:hypothetical protein